MNDKTPIILKCQQPPSYYCYLKNYGCTDKEIREIFEREGYGENDMNVDSRNKILTRQEIIDKYNEYLDNRQALYQEYKSVIKEYHKLEDEWHQMNADWGSRYDCTNEIG